MHDAPQPRILPTQPRATADPTAIMLSRRAVLALGGGLIATALHGGGQSVAAQPATLYGPADGRLVHPAAGTTAARPVVRDVVPLHDADYAISATFRNPYAAITSGVFDRSFVPPDAYRQWSYGFDFRLTPARGGAVYVDSLTFSWGATIFAPDPAARATLQRRPLRTWRGGLPDLRIGEGETNDLQLALSGPIGQFMVNGEEIAALDLSDLPGPGDAAVGTGYTNYAGVFGLVPGAATGYEAFTITPAPPPTPFGQRALSDRYGPVNGGIRQTHQGSNRSSTSQTGEGFTTGARMTDGIINARFFNPYDAAEQPWDYGFWLRSNATPTSGTTGGYYALAIRSDSTYALTLNRPVSRGYSARAVQGGRVCVRTGAGEPNDVEVHANGSGGLLAVNGEVIAALDLHDLADEGDVHVLTALDVPARKGAVTRYENCTVAPLPAPTQAVTQRAVSRDR